MQGDADAELDPDPRHDLWRLPRITALEIRRVRYRRPRRHTIGGKLVAHDEGVEILVETDGDIPIRALSPALHVGSAEVAENERTGDASYRFFVLDEAALRPGEPIALGWVGHPAADTATEFRYHPPSDTLPESAH